MRIKEAISRIERYWEHCAGPSMVLEAKRDHQLALRELSTQGYTWGLKHQLPFEFTDQSFTKNDYKIMLNVLFGKSQRRRRDYQNKNRKENRTN